MAKSPPKPFSRAPALRTAHIGGIPNTWGGDRKHQAGAARSLAFGSQSRLVAVMSKTPTRIALRPARSQPVAAKVYSGRFCSPHRRVKQYEEYGLSTVFRRPTKDYN